MPLIKKAIHAVEEMTKDCGISESPVILEPGPDITPCPYESGTMMRVTFGGRSAGISTNEPLSATTKASFMFTAPLRKRTQIMAAAGIVNAIMAFLCRIRKPYPCMTDDHPACLRDLKQEIAGKKIWYTGESNLIREICAGNLVSDPSDATLILVTGDLLGAENGNIQEGMMERVIFLGPSVSGTAAALNGCHFCPYGRANL